MNAFLKHRSREIQVKLCSASTRRYIYMPPESDLFHRKSVKLFLNESRKLSQLWYSNMYCAYQLITQLLPYCL